jgi:UDP-N-acetylglucosamine 2-epimerase (non-hydrolysing)
MLNICIVAGARPNFIKVAPLIRAILKAKSEGKLIDYRLIYSGTKKDNTIEPSLFNDLQMPEPDAYLGVDNINLNELTGNVMFAFERELNDYPADVVIVVDDLASTMAAAIVTKKKGKILAHLVAGTRSFDIKMPKEINRMVIDGLSDLLFTAGVGSNRNVGREGAELSHVYMVGNILMDTLRFNHNRFTKPVVFDNLNLEEKKYIVFTINRHALLFNKDNLKKTIEIIARNTAGIPVVMPARKYTHDVVSKITHDSYHHIHIIEPQTYLGFGYLTAHAMGIITDSGNVAEEATFNSVPCITLNNYTEHIETVNDGTNVLVGEDENKLSEAVIQMVSENWKKCSLPDRWDGRTAERIIQTLMDYKIE